MRLSTTVSAAMLAFAVAVPASALAGETVTITDVTGREVQVEIPVDAVILGEGRLIYAVAALDTENPFQRVVGWRDDLMKADFDTYSVYHAKYPSIDDIPTFGGLQDGTFDIEQAITLDPDVLIMNLEAKDATEDAGLDEKLSRVGIPLVYVDFREAPIKNTDASMRIIGKLSGLEDRAEEFIEFRKEQIERVTDRLAEADPEKPLVFLERAAGFTDECCNSFGNENFGRMVEMAGGVNMAEDIIPGTFGTVNPEQIVASNPDQIIVTGANWEEFVPNGPWVGLGPNADLETAEKKLYALMDRPAFTGVKAVENGDVHAVWHQFYNSPYQFVVIQQMAKWLHPELFADLDPAATFRELHERFLTVDYQPGYFVSLSDSE